MQDRNPMIMIIPLGVAEVYGATEDGRVISAHRITKDGYVNGSDKQSRYKVEDPLIHQSNPKRDILMNVLFFNNGDLPMLVQPVPTEDGKALPIGAELDPGQGMIFDFHHSHEFTVEPLIHEPKPLKAA